jgi:hypothetical protein
MKKRQLPAEAVTAVSAQHPPESPEGQVAAASTDPRLTRAHDLIISDDDTPPVASASGEPAQAISLKKNRPDLERGVSQGERFVDAKSVWLL